MDALQVLCECQAMQAQPSQPAWTQLLDALVKFLEHKTASNSSGAGCTARISYDGYGLNSP